MARTRLSLKATIRLTLLLVASSVILAAVALFSAFRGRDLACAADQQAAAVGEVVAEDLLWYLRHCPQGPLSDWLTRAGSWPRVHGITVLQDNSVLATNDAWPLTPAQMRLGRHYNTSIMIPLNEETPDGHPLALQVQPLSAKPLNIKVLIVLTITPDSGMASLSWAFFLPLAVIGLLGVFIAVMWLDHEVVRPIELLSKISTNPTLAGQLGEATGALCYTELTALAQTLRGLHVNLNQWRHKVDRLERTFDTRVQEQTRQISKTLQRTQLEVWRDPLTGLYNRRMLTANGQKMVDEQVQAEGDISVLMFDVDHFKTLNDTMGHMAGDEMLQFVAQLLKQAIRREDVAVRYGGDEFLLLLPGVSITDAEQIAGRAIGLFRQHTKLLTTLDPRPTLSAGVASLATTNVHLLDELVQLADSALYQAKRGGKNCVGVYNPTVPHETPAEAPSLAAASLAGVSRRILN